MQTLRKTLVGCLLFVYLGVSQASFLDDFYTTSGAAVNVTPGQIYHTENMTLVHGGSMVFRAPNNDFRAFYVNPPSLKAGCGGIDMFLGAFGFASRGELIAFMQNVGQNTAGLAFGMAMQSMSPETWNQINDWATKIREMNKYYRNSCQVATQLLDAAGLKQQKSADQKATLNCSGTMGAGDYDLCVSQQTENDFLQNNYPKSTNPNGVVTDAHEINIVWAALNSGEFSGLSNVEKELMMSLTGTVIMRQQPSKQLSPESKPQIISKIGDLIDKSGNNLRIYKCDEYLACLNPSDTGTYPSAGFWKTINTDLKRLRDAISNGSPPGPQEMDTMKRLFASTSIPIYRIISATTVRGGGINRLDDVILEQYSDFVAYDVAANFLTHIADAIGRSIQSDNDSPNSSSYRKEHMTEVLTRLRSMASDARMEQNNLYKKTADRMQLIQHIEHMQRSINTNLSAALIANLRFGR